MRLVSDGFDSTTSEGRVEVCLLGEWGSVCNSSFEVNIDGSVICRQLGFAGKYTHTVVLLLLLVYTIGVIDVIPYGEGNNSITWLDIGCNGTEDNILQCNSVRDDDNSSICGSDVGLRCLQTMSPMSGESVPKSMMCTIPTHTDEESFPVVATVTSSLAGSILSILFLSAIVVIVIKYFK